MVSGSWPFIDITHPQIANIGMYCLVDKGHILHGTMIKIYHKKAGHGTTSVPMEKNVLVSNCYMMQERLQFQNSKEKFVTCKRQNLHTGERGFLVQNGANLDILVREKHPNKAIMVAYLAGPWTIEI